MRLASAALVVLTGFVASPVFAAELKPETVRAWDNYVRLVQERIDGELQSGTPFLVLDRIEPAKRQKARDDLSAGSVFMVQLEAPGLTGPAPKVPSGIVHHWLGAVRIPGATLKQVVDFVQRYDEHARYFEDVVASKLLSRQGDRFEIFLKLRRKKFVTVTYNTNHSVLYRHHDSVRESSRSVATHIAELEDAGGRSEREKPVGKDSGYLWRLNSYWRFAQDGAGVVVECESLTLSRDIPWPFEFFIRGIVEDIARESLERTLSSIRSGMARQKDPE